MLRSRFVSSLAWHAGHTVVLGLVGLTCIAANGYFAFWLWFLSPRAGHAVTFLLPIFGIACLLWARARLDAGARSALNSLLLPAALVLCAALLVLSAGFLYGGHDKPIETPWTRFSHRLPPDNMLPFLFAEEVRIGHIYKPFFEGGHSSDRPPLQAAIALSQYPFLPRPRALGYTALGGILQSLWIYVLWLLLRAFHVDPSVIALALLVTLFSGFTFLNTFFVWPKLLAAAYMIAFSIHAWPFCPLPQFSRCCPLWRAPSKSLISAPSASRLVPGPIMSPLTTTATSSERPSPRQRLRPDFSSPQMAARRFRSNIPAPATPS